MPNRLPKLPPDPDDLASLKRFRDYNAEVAEILKDLIRIAAPGARDEKKAFSFEKKNQKTFAPVPHAAGQPRPR